MPNGMYSITELGPILGLHPKTIARFIHEGKLHARKIGREWRVAEQDLKEFCHGELAGNEAPPEHPDYGSLAGRVRSSAVVEIDDQGSEEASRISTSFHAMLMAERGSDPTARFDFFYYPELRKGKYVFYGSPSLCARALEALDVLCQSKE